GDQSGFFFGCQRHCDVRHKSVLCRSLTIELYRTGKLEVRVLAKRLGNKLGTISAEHHQKPTRIVQDELRRINKMDNRTHLDTVEVIGSIPVAPIASNLWVANSKVAWFPASLGGIRFFDYKNMNGTRGVFGGVTIS